MEFLLRCRLEISKIQMIQIFKVSINDLQFVPFADIIIRNKIFKGYKPVDL